ncbi:MAG: hypothetical protein KatS3mg065_0343 [Chloroflexota bacterium]|nr:MAG: hypothetical protein KatS3mg065_0343 [Chloroflexota bacterium]
MIDRAAAEPARRVGAPEVETWLRDLGLEPLARSQRDGVTSWDLLLDGRRRFDVPVTVICDPSLAVIVWLHLAPPIGDSVRASYRRLLRWNDEFPFVKFALAPDERPVLTVELPIESVDGDALGLAIARVLAVADVLLDETAAWLWIGGKVPPPPARERRNEALFARYRDRLGELGG